MKELPLAFRFQLQVNFTHFRKCQEGGEKSFLMSVFIETNFQSEKRGGNSEMGEGTRDKNIWRLSIWTLWIFNPGNGREGSRNRGRKIDMKRRKMDSMFERRGMLKKEKRKVTIHLALSVPRVLSRRREWRWQRPVDDGHRYHLKVEGS